MFVPSLTDYPALECAVHRPPANMSTLDYANPPVHEVVVSLAFDAATVTPEAFAAQAGAAPWPERLRERVELEDTRILGRASPIGGEPAWQTRVVRTGLALSDQQALDATRALQLRPELASYHVVRPLPRERGTYAGWPTTAAELAELQPTLAALYGDARVTRLALRYLNRIVIPAGASLDDWLTVGAFGPAGVGVPASFSVRLLWAQLDDAPEFGASLSLYAVDPDDEPTAQEDDLTLLLDLEVAALNEDGAVTWDTISGVLSRAHDAHGALFEACLTDALRDTFRSDPAVGTLQPRTP